MKLRKLLLLLLIVNLAGVIPALAEEKTGPEAEVKALMDEAKKLGAKGQLPLEWWDLNNRFKTAKDEGADEGTWYRLTRDATLLRNRAAFIDEMRKKKSGMEALLGRFDQALDEIAALYGLTNVPVLTGSARAADLIAQLDDENFRRQVVVDSLQVSNRRLSESMGGWAVSQDSLITALQMEIRVLRHELWETELRVGVAEADRSAAETTLNIRQQRADTIARVRSSFTPQEAEALLTTTGDLVLRVHGLAFDVGSAEVKLNQDDLLIRLAQAIGYFPHAPVRVEGHTDNTGGREANLRLSRRRAETVAALLADLEGRKLESIATAGYGPDRPVALNSTPEGRALNRRIDVVISTTY